LFCSALARIVNIIDRFGGRYKLVHPSERREGRALIEEKRERGGGDIGPR
jgi:hypothetical protein